MTSPPSGRQLEIALGDQRAIVVEVGGGLRTYSVAGRDVLDGYGLDQLSTSGRGQVLIPWPNRVRDGRYEFDGTRHQLPLDDVPEQDAIHGLVRWTAWTVAAHDPDRVVMEHVIHPRPGYPFTLSLSIEYELSAAGLSVRTTAMNRGATACPYGAGAHPYLTVEVAPIDRATLRAPGATVLRADRRGIPIDRAPVDGTEYDFRKARPIETTKLDHAFTDLERDAAGRAHVRLEAPGTGVHVSLWIDESYPFLMLFTGDPLPDVDRRSLAVEPMTCPPNALASGEGLIRLEPESSHTGSWGIVPGR